MYRSFCSVGGAKRIHKKEWHARQNDQSSSAHSHLVLEKLISKLESVKTLLYNEPQGIFFVDVLTPLARGLNNNN